jgi:serine/threonine protein phosphatase 1
MTTSRLIAIGDVHGCIHALDALLEAIQPAPQDQLVFLGDLIDQGHDTRDVLQRIIRLEQECHVVLIQGNHEEMLYAARNSEQALRYWENCGGVFTLNSYRFGGGLEYIPAEHWALLDRSLPYYETDEFIFTHAHFLPNLPMSEQPAHQLRWAMFDPAETLPHVSGKPVTVGHTEQMDSEVLDLGYATCIDTACWRHGWLTALDVLTKETWQASRWGLMRDTDEPSHRGSVPLWAGRHRV